MPCDQLSSPTLRDCRWWDRSGQTASDISLHRLDNLPVIISDLDNSDPDNRHPLFIRSSDPLTGYYCSNGLHDCLRAYENIEQVMKVIGNIVRSLINRPGFPPVDFSQYDMLFFIILDQRIDLSKLYLQNDSDSINLENNALCIPYAQKVIFGQYIIDGIRHSAAIQLEVVAHEFCHILISKILNPDRFPDKVNRFSDKGEYGALEESFCDIFAVLISRHIRDTWNWEIGQNMGTPSGRTLRNFCNPENSGPPQPSHYRDFVIGGDVHINCGIHNKAFHNIIDSKYFAVDFLIELLIRTILGISENKLGISENRNLSGRIIEAKFSDSRKAMQTYAKTMLRRTGLGDADVETQVNAISQAFNKVGIELPT